jgi:hypothetical protein
MDALWFDAQKCHPMIKWFCWFPSISLAASITLAIPASSWAQADHALRKEVEELISQLNDADVEKQNAAELKLRSLDPSVRAFFPAPDASADSRSATAKRLEQIRIDLDRRALVSSVKASLVNLEGTMDLSEALQEIGRQTGNRLLDYRNRFGDAAPMTVTLRAKNQEFWHVLDELLPQNGLVIYPFPGEPHSVAIIADPNRVGQSIVSRDRFLRVEVVKLFAVRDLRDPFQTGLRLTLEIVWEPRIRPIYLKHRLDKFEATDDLGQVLRSTTRGQVESPVLSGVAGVECTIPIELPTRQANRIATLHGETEVFLPGGMLQLQIPDITQANPEARTQNLVVRIDQVETNEGLLNIRLSVRHTEPPESVPSHYGWMEDQRVVLKNQAGEVLVPIGSETLSRKNGEFGIAYKFEAANPKDWSLVFETPSTIVPVSFQYEFKDLLLP